MKRSLENGLAGMSLRHRLLIYFILISLVPAFFIGFISYQIATHVIEKMAMQSGMEMVDRSNIQMDAFFSDTYRLSAILSDDPFIQQTLREPLDMSIKKRYSTALAMDTKLNSIELYQPQFHIYIIGANGGSYKSNFNMFRHGDLRSSAWYNRIAKSAKPIWFSTHSGSFAVETVGDSYMTVGFPIKDKANGQLSGVMLIDFESKLLPGLVYSNLVKKGFMYIVNENNEVLYQSSDSWNIAEFPNLEQTERVEFEYHRANILSPEGKKFIAIFKTSSVTGWKVVGVISREELTRESQGIGLFILGVWIVIGLLAILAAWTLAGSVTKPINKMMMLMRRVEEGDLTVSMNVKYKDEIGMLGRSFNRMLLKISHWVEGGVQEQQALRKAELKALQVQINSHFLYNTLESIIWMARVQRYGEVIVMVSALTKLFRISISRGQDIISIQEEMEHIKSYLTIMHLRYKSKLSYEIDVDPALNSYKTLKLLLQPIVENAIYHGVKLKKEKGIIRITVMEEQNSIVFRVEDSGKGMLPETLEALIHTLEKSEGKQLDSYGVRNVSERIKIFFGMDYGLTYWSEYEVGTTVEIRIPKITEVEDYVKSSLG